MTHFSYRRLDIEIGNFRAKKFGLYIPDGLHIWIGNKGLHCYWSFKPHFEKNECKI